MLFYCAIKILQIKMLCCIVNAPLMSQEVKKTNSKSYLIYACATKIKSLFQG